MSDHNQPAPKRTRPKSRPVRWAEACGDALTALASVEAAMGEFEQAVAALRGIQEEFEDWQGNLNENLANSALGEKLQSVCDLEIDGIAEELQGAIDEARGKIDEAEATDLPLGFGRD